MKSKKIVAILALLGATFTAANAQFMMMGGGGMSQGMVLFAFSQDGPSIRSDVSKELKITDEQKTKLNDFQQKQMEEMMASFQGGERPSQEEMQKIMKKRQEGEDKALKEILDEKQRTRLHELWIQRMGNRAYMNADIQKDLEFTDDQKAKVKDIQKKQQEAMAAMREKMLNGEIDRSEIRGIMEKSNKTLGDELAKIATPGQAEKLKKMGGAEFKFDPDNFGG